MSPADGGAVASKPKSKARPLTKKEREQKHIERLMSVLVPGCQVCVEASGAIYGKVIAATSKLVTIEIWGCGGRTIELPPLVIARAEIAQISGWSRQSEINKAMRARFGLATGAQ